MTMVTQYKKTVLETIKCHPGITQAEICATLSEAENGKRSTNSFSAMMSEMAKKSLFTRVRTQQTKGGLTFKLYPLGTKVSVDHPMALEPLRRGKNHVKGVGHIYAKGSVLTPTGNGKGGNGNVTVEQPSLAFEPVLATPIVGQTMRHTASVDYDAEVQAMTVEHARGLYDALKRVFAD